MLDMRLPDGRTGLDLLVDLRNIPELVNIPVLIVTGSALTPAEQTTITKHRGFVFFKPEGFSIDAMKIAEWIPATWPSTSGRSTPPRWSILRRVPRRGARR